jgi:predicted ATPase
LRLLKDLLHIYADRSSARLVSVIGPAGIGKTRLLAELANYVDGLAEVVLWHSGRCLSYGEGVAYSALAQMVRQRAAIPEEATPAETDEKLRAALGHWIDEPEERAQLGDALAVLVGPGEAELERQGLHAAWRLFFERLSGRHPVVLAFEDMQWADDGMLEFVSELVEFASDCPIFVCALGREEPDDRRAEWAASLAAGTCIRLEPLAPDLIAALLGDLAPGLPGPATGRIVGRAEGVPLYAVEMVRTLAERGTLDLERGLLRPGDLDDLEVPASLNSLLEARLDRLGADERELVKAMAVFGESFPRASAAALSDLEGTRVDEVLASLVRKGVLTIRSDPLSPERGQYKFAQAILRTVAYEMISKRERRPRHLAAAEHLATSFPNKGDEVAEQIATHLLAAYAVEPDEDLRERVLDALRRAAKRALAVGAPEAAERSLQRAVQLADGGERGELLAAAGRAAELAGDHETALDHLERARDVFLAAGGMAEADRLEGPISLALGRLGRQEDSIRRLRAVTDALEEGRIGIDGATLLCELGRSLLFAGHPEEASAEIERALTAAEALDAPELMCRLLNLKGSLATDLCRYDEARALKSGELQNGVRL